MQYFLFGLFATNSTGLFPIFFVLHTFASHFPVQARLLFAFLERRRSKKAIKLLINSVASKFANLTSAPSEIRQARSKSEELLKETIRSYPTANLKVNAAFFILVNLAVWSCALVGFVGMFFLWHVAPYFFAAAVFCKVFMLPFVERAWYVSNRWAMPFSHLECMLDEVILMLVFFGPARHLFFISWTLYRLI